MVQIVAILSCISTQNELQCADVSWFWCVLVFHIFIATPLFHQSPHLTASPGQSHFYPGNGVPADGGDLQGRGFRNEGSKISLFSKKPWKKVKKGWYG